MSDIEKLLKAERSVVIHLQNVIDLYALTDMEVLEMLHRLVGVGISRIKGDCAEEAQAASERLAMERDEARAEVERAYKHGAEAMREAAAQKVAGYNVVVHDSVGHSIQLAAQSLANVAADIRALPIPEGKR
jgi:hypothetical protein